MADDDQLDETPEHDDEFGIDQKRMSFLDHLLELRSRILISFATLAIAFIAFFFVLRKNLVEWMLLPVTNAWARVQDHPALGEIVKQKARSLPPVKKLASLRVQDLPAYRELTGQPAQGPSGVGELAEQKLRATPAFRNLVRQLAQALRGAGATDPLRVQELSAFNDLATQALQDLSPIEELTEQRVRDLPVFKELIEQVAQALRQPGAAGQKVQELPALKKLGETKVGDLPALNELGGPPIRGLPDLGELAEQRIQDLPGFGELLDRLAEAIRNPRKFSERNAEDLDGIKALADRTLHDLPAFKRLPEQKVQDIPALKRLGEQKVRDLPAFGELVHHKIGSLPGFAELTEEWRQNPLMFVRTPTSLFMGSLYYCLFAAIAVTIPVTIYQLWGFVAPGLKRRERRVIGPVILASTGLFLLGAVFAYFVVIPVTMEFFLRDTLDLGWDSVRKVMLFEPKWDIGETLKLEGILMLVLGIAFEAPIAIVALTKIGIVTPKGLAKFRRHAILVNFVIAAIATPTQDPITLSLVAIPMCILYEVGIQASKFFYRRPDVEESEETDESALPGDEEPPSPEPPPEPAGPPPPTEGPPPEGPPAEAPIAGDRAPIAGNGRPPGGEAIPGEAPEGLPPQEQMAGEPGQGPGAPESPPPQRAPEPPKPDAPSEGGDLPPDAIMH
jgi:sec-independent protein translocase protein TatC